MSDKQVEENLELEGFRNISLQMHTATNSTCCSTWWEVLENCTDTLYQGFLKLWPYNSDCEHNLVLYAFSDKLFPETLSIFTAGG